jgi:hypothetical protein
MPAPKREWLEQRHRYSEWAGRSEVPSDRRLRRFTFLGDELPGWALERGERREAGPTPARVTGFWRRGDPKAVLRVDVFECVSLDAAHKYLIDALGEFESAAIARRTDAKLGDVAFGTNTVALFARGNLVVLVRNAAREVVPVTEIAQALDAMLLRRLREG